MFALSSDGWARHLARDGTLLAVWDVTRLDRGRTSRPVDIAVDDAGRVYVVDGGADIVTVYAWDPNAPAVAPPEVDTGCEFEPFKTASPAEIPLGETVEIALVLRGACAKSQEAADIGLLIDTSIVATTSLTFRMTS